MSLSSKLQKKNFLIKPMPSPIPLDFSNIVAEISRQIITSKINEAHTEITKEMKLLARQMLEQNIERLRGPKGNPGESITGEQGPKPILGIDYKIPEPIKGDPGQNATPEDVVPLVLAKLPKLEKQIIETPESIVKKLNTLVEAVHWRVIKGLKEELSKRTGTKQISGSGGSWYQANLSGLINGSNTIYTFSGAKPKQYSERIFLNYIEQNPINGDYTINYDTKTVTYASAPDVSLSGLPHIIRYQS